MLETKRCTSEGCRHAAPSKEHTPRTHRSNIVRGCHYMRNVNTAESQAPVHQIYAVYTPEQQADGYKKYMQCLCQKCTRRSDKWRFTLRIRNVAARKVHTGATSCCTPKEYAMYTPEQQVAVHPKYTQCFCQKCTRRSNKLRYTQSIRNAHTGATSCGTPKVYAMHTPEQQVAIHPKYTQCTHRATSCDTPKVYAMFTPGNKLRYT